MAAWTSPSAADFAHDLALATAPASPVWVEYEAADGAFVLDAGTSESGAACLGLWQRGRVVAFAALPEAPRLLTPLYGYHLTYPGNGGPFDGLLAASTQPESIRRWLAEHGVETAVVMPVDIVGLPFELTTLLKVQTAIHEAFHIDVQAEGWLDSSEAWPVWDLQPDRDGLARCYGDSPAIEAAFESERQVLTSLIEALLDSASAPACEAGAGFLRRRSARYEALAGVEIARHDGTMGTCQEAEAIMEIEEGTADYASWPRLYGLGIATRDQLMQRYRAQQSEVFYLTGAMQLHAVSLMSGDGVLDFTRRIARSSSPLDGSPTAVLREALEAYCLSAPTR